MKRLYIDTSAALKLFLHVAESDACADFLFDELREGAVLLASTWMVAELSSVMRRIYGVERVDGLEQFLDSCVLVESSADDIRTVAKETWTLRSGDGLHLACALAHHATHIITYDATLAKVASDRGIIALSPRVADTQ